MTESDMEIKLSADDTNDDVQKSIVVPIDEDMDTVKTSSPNTVDELAMELATIKQSAKKIAIIGSRNLPITHQQMIETLEASANVIIARSECSTILGTPIS